jgi:hypothetical protein
MQKSRKIFNFLQFFELLKSKNTAINVVKSAKKTVNFLLFSQFSDIFCNFLQFFDFNIIVCIVGNLSQDHKFMVFMLFSRICAIFVLHRGKFTVAQGHFYDGKFFMVNSKKRHKSENWRKSPMLTYFIKKLNN